MDGTEGQEVAPATTEGVGTTDQPAGDSTTPAPEAWDGWSEHEGKYIPIKVNGEEQLVPLSELRDGYMRQGDYTQKTQLLSQAQQELAWASTIAQALEENPEQALNILQGQYMPETPQEEQEFLTDEERQLNELQEWRQEQEQREAVRQVEVEMEQLQQQFGSEFFEPNQLVQYALQGDFKNLTDALQSMKFSELYGETQAIRDQRAMDAQREAEQAAAQEEARKAAGIVGGGHNVPPGSTQRGTPGELLSVRESWARAQEAENQ